MQMLAWEKMGEPVNKNDLPIYESCTLLFMLKHAGESTAGHFVHASLGSDLFARFAIDGRKSLKERSYSAPNGNRRVRVASTSSSLEYPREWSWRIDALMAADFDGDGVEDLLVAARHPCLAYDRFGWCLGAFVVSRLASGGPLTAKKPALRPPPGLAAPSLP